MEQSSSALVNFRGTDVRDVVFRELPSIDELDLEDAVARMAVEVHQRHPGVGRSQRHAERRRPPWVGIGTVRHLDGLRGTTIDSDQAVRFAAHFAAHLGMRIE